MNVLCRALGTGIYGLLVALSAAGCGGGGGSSTPAGAQLVRNINPGALGSAQANFTDVNGTLFGTS